MLLLALLAAPAFAQDADVTRIDNTASVNYNLGGTTTATEVISNTVTFTVRQGPSPATIEFFRLADPGTPGSVDFPYDGGECRNDQGEFDPLVSGNAGFDLADASAPTLASAPTQTYDPGDLVVVRLTDLNRNEDPAVREFVEATIHTSDGDTEVLRLLETGPDTGVFAAAIQSVAIPPPAVPSDCRLSVGSSATLTATYVDPDYPDDETTDEATTDVPPRVALLLRKDVAVPQASAGDFLQYRLVVENRDPGAVQDVTITDVLPNGLAFQAGSLRVDGVRVDGSIGPDGRTLSIPVGDLAPAGRAQVTYVLAVGAGARAGELVNRATAAATGGVVSNPAEAVVRIVEPLATSHFTIIGRIVAGACGTSTDELSGVPDVRVMLDDGTYVPSDRDGLFHFEGVRPGTHVVQVDLATIPAGHEVVPCAQDTRHAGRGYSQFVEGAGGALMRTDFRLQPVAGALHDAGIRVRATRQGDRIRHEVVADGGSVAVTKLRAMVMLPAGATLVPGSATVDGASVPDIEVREGVATLALGDQAGHWRKQVAFETVAPACPGEGAATRALLMFEAGGTALRTPPAEATLPCDAASPLESPRQAIVIEATPTADEAVSPFQRLEEKRAAMRAGSGAVGARDWLTGQVPGNAWLLPATDNAAAMPTESIVVKHAPGHEVELRLNGAPVSGLHVDGRKVNAERTIAVSRWRGVQMADGVNKLEAVLRDADGNVVETLVRHLNFTNEVARAELVPAESLLVADGVHRAVVAVRMLDGAGRPVRPGVGGKFTVAAPYAAADAERMQQQRQLAGMESFDPTWEVEGDDGIAYIELQPTSLSGEVTLGFEFRRGEHRGNTQQLKAWLKSQPRDWVVVGFAKGTVGYDTLDGNMEALDAAGHEAGTTGDGQVSLYAKGRVLGKWMLTLAYDSDKPTDALRRQALLSTIDPDQFYTLYGDGTGQAYDAASTEKLYLKLERDTFYALFGDFTTGLDDGELTRYHRTLTGAKVEYRGEVLVANAFAAKTTQDFMREELQGDGTSGLYRLSRRGIAINGERVRIEVRDRYRSEVVLEVRELARHVDYDIDYAAGTLFFREPVPSRDFDFNPVFIVVEYEIHGNGEEFVNAGGRLGVEVLDGRLRAGVTYVHDEDATGRSRLAGVDATYKVGQAAELRAEVAASEGVLEGGLERSGTAYLVEYAHHGERLDLLAYVRRLSPGFGLGQQSQAEQGMFKVGTDAQWRISDNFVLQGKAWHQEDLVSGVERDAVNAEVEYRAPDWSASAGLQWTRDTAPDGRIAESRLVTLGARKGFLGNRLELSARTEVALDGANDSVDYPTRYEVGASYAINDAFRVLVAHEITDGDAHDTTNTRFGFEARPWAGATLTSTLNQANISEFGPRTFGVLGLQQQILVGDRWSIDLAADSSHTLEATGQPPLVTNPSHPIAPGGTRAVAALSEDFMALSGGATYRAELWSLTGRAEYRDGEASDRYGFTTGFLRQAQAGIAFAATAQAFSVDNADGSRGLLAHASLAWAWRPLGSRWSLLDRLELRVDELQGGQGAAVIGQDTLAVAGDARSARLVNNLVLNYVGDAWNEDDRRGNLFDAAQRSQLSLYYGSKYVFDTYDEEDYSGYTDILGIDWRHDLSDKLDVGLRASVRHAWDQGEVSYAFGPSIGFTPFTNAWFSVGYNVVGFDDRDFQAMHYTAQGPYLMLRFKFDQDTFGLAPAAAGDAP